MRVRGAARPREEVIFQFLKITNGIGLGLCGTNWGYVEKFLSLQIHPSLYFRLINLLLIKCVLHFITFCSCILFEYEIY